MKIGQMLKDARASSGFTQEQVAEAIAVSRQTISNWENEKSYPDIVSVIKLSDLYDISLDKLLKEDDKMVKYVNESANVVASNRKLIAAILANILLLAILIAFSGLIPENSFYLAGVFSLAIISSAILLYQIIKRI